MYIYIHIYISRGAPVTREHTMSKAQLIRLLIQHGPILHNFTKSRFVEIWRIICGYEDSLSSGVMRRITLDEIMNKENENCDLIEFQDILKNTVKLFLDKPTLLEMKECIKEIGDMYVTLDIPQSQVWRKPIVCFHESLATYISKSKYVFLEMVPSCKSSDTEMHKICNTESLNVHVMVNEHKKEEVCKNYIERSESYGLGQTESDLYKLQSPILCFHCEDGLYENVRICVDSGDGDCTTLIEEYMLDEDGTRDFFLLMKHNLESITNKIESNHEETHLMSRNIFFDIPICEFNDVDGNLKRIYYNIRLNTYYAQEAFVNIECVLFCHYAMIEIFKLRKRLNDIKNHTKDVNCIEELDLLIWLCDLELPAYRKFKKVKLS